jgi:hypothetical protein
MTDREIQQLIKQFMQERKPLLRDASFDYCFNYFRRFKNEGRLRELTKQENLEKSCLHLGFFLASWGMFRMSSKLGQKASAKHFEKVIREISHWAGSHELAGIWEIDVPDYKDESAIQDLTNCYAKIKELILPNEQKSHLTLVTKTMLGLFGCVPAFDSLFISTFKLYTFKEDALKTIYEFYERHHTAINRESDRAMTLDFLSGEETTTRYKVAKIIDMIGFQKGKIRAKAEAQKG